MPPSHSFELSLCLQIGALLRVFLISETTKSRRELRQDCMEADVAVRRCVYSNIAAPDWRNARVRYHGAGASRHSPKAAAVFI